MFMTILILFIVVLMCVAFGLALKSQNHRDRLIGQGIHKRNKIVKELHVASVRYYIMTAILGIIWVVALILY